VTAPTPTVTLGRPAFLVGVAGAALAVWILASSAAALMVFKNVTGRWPFGLVDFAIWLEGKG